MVPPTIHQIVYLVAQTTEAKKEYTPITIEQVVLWIAVLASLVLVGFYLVSVFRGNAHGVFDESTNQLDDFRKLRQEGMLDDEEFARVKSSIVHKGTTDTAKPTVTKAEPKENIDFIEDTTEESDDTDQE